MHKAPCETAVWDVLPCLRSALARRLKQRGMRQTDIAELLGVSPAAVSQYLSKKRGCSDLVEEAACEELDASAMAIMDGAPVTRELCRLCRIMQRCTLGVEVPC
ncbi:MAG: helix-turn-helix domain-containing protein [Thermoplasmatota archaeon]